MTCCCIPRVNSTDMIKDIIDRRDRGQEKGPEYQLAQWNDKYSVNTAKEYEISHRIITRRSSWPMIYMIHNCLNSFPGVKMIGSKCEGGLLLLGITPSYDS